MPKITVKRVYEPAAENDGFRVLVDRLWPRGLKKENAAIDQWLKDLAPSPSLRKWFNHDPLKWEGFVKAYERELSQNTALVEFREDLKERAKVTLLYAAKDELHNHALVLKNLLLRPEDN